MKSIQSFHISFEDINSLINNLKNYKKILIIHSIVLIMAILKKIKNIIKSKMNISIFQK